MDLYIDRQHVDEMIDRIHHERSRVAEAGRLIERVEREKEFPEKKAYRKVRAMLDELDSMMQAGANSLEVFAERYSSFSEDFSADLGDLLTESRRMFV